MSEQIILHLPDPTTGKQSKFKLDLSFDCYFVVIRIHLPHVYFLTFIWEKNDCNLHPKHEARGADTHYFDISDLCIVLQISVMVDKISISDHSEKVKTTTFMYATVLLEVTSSDQFPGIPTARFEAKLLKFLMGNRFNRGRFRKVANSSTD